MMLCIHLCAASSGTIVSGVSTTVVGASGGGGTARTSTSRAGISSSQQTFSSGESNVLCTCYLKVLGLIISASI